MQQENQNSVTSKVDRRDQEVKDEKRMTSGPDRHYKKGRGRCDGSGSYVFHRTPQAVRSARGGGRDRELPSAASAGRTFQADKCDAFGLAVHVYWLRHVSRTAAIRAVVRIGSCSPQGNEIFAEQCLSGPANSVVLRITNKIPRRGMSCKKKVRDFSVAYRLSNHAHVRSRRHSAGGSARSRSSSNLVRYGKLATCAPDCHTPIPTQGVRCIDSTLRSAARVGT